MEVAKAKFFVLKDLNDENIIYVSKDLQLLIDKVDGLVSLIDAVMETEGGEVMFDMDEDYYGEPIIMRKFMHYDTYKAFRSRCKFIKI